MAPFWGVFRNIILCMCMNMFARRKLRVPAGVSHVGIIRSVVQTIKHNFSSPHDSDNNGHVCVGNAKRGRNCNLLTSLSRWSWRRGNRSPLPIPPDARYCYAAFSLTAFMFLFNFPFFFLSSILLFPIAMCAHTYIHTYKCQYSREPFVCKH